MLNPEGTPLGLVSASRSIHSPICLIRPIGHIRPIHIKFLSTLISLISNQAPISETQNEVSVYLVIVAFLG